MSKKNCELLAVSSKEIVKDRLLTKAAHITSKKVDKLMGASKETGLLFLLPQFIWTFSFYMSWVKGFTSVRLN